MLIFFTSYSGTKFCLQWEIRSGIKCNPVSRLRQFLRMGRRKWAVPVRIRHGKTGGTDSPRRCEIEEIMSRICQVTGKRPAAGNNVSHAKNRTRRRFLPNLHQHRFWVESEKRFVRLRVSAKGMRIIDKKGIEQVLEDIRARGDRV